MKRTLLLVRHAKSSWASPLQSDFERPLNERGLRNAPEMGKRLKAAGLVPDLIISSSALRTRQTATLLAEELGYDAEKIQWEEKLYHASPATIEDVIFGAPDHAAIIMIVTHNPGITDLVNQLSPRFATGNMPTCGVVGATFEAAGWSQYPQAKRNVFLFDYPKNEHDAE